MTFQEILRLVAPSGVIDGAGLCHALGRHNIIKDVELTPYDGNLHLPLAFLLAEYNLFDEAEAVLKRAELAVLDPDFIEMDGYVLARRSMKEVGQLFPLKIPFRQWQDGPRKHFASRLDETCDLEALTAWYPFRVEAIYKTGGVMFAKIIAYEFNGDGDLVPSFSDHLEFDSFLYTEPSVGDVGELLYFVGASAPSAIIHLDKDELPPIAERMNSRIRMGLKKIKDDLSHPYIRGKKLFESFDDKMDCLARYDEIDGDEETKSIEDWSFEDWVKKASDGGETYAYDSISEKRGSKFAQFLEDSFAVVGWSNYDLAKFFGVNFDVIIDWLEDKRIPSSANMKMLVELVNRFDPVRFRRIYYPMATWRADKISPLGTLMLPSVQEYTNRLVFSEIASALAKLDVKDQAALLRILYPPDCPICGEEVLVHNYCDHCDKG